MKFVKFKNGTRIKYQGRVFKIRRVLRDLKTLIVENLATREVMSIPLNSDVVSFTDSEEEPIYEPPPLDNFTDKEIVIAKQRYKIIEPFLADPCNPATIKKIAKKNKIGVSTFYRWRKRYRDTQQLTALVDRKGRGGEGKPRLEKKINNVIDDIIQEVYFKQKKSIPYTYREIVHQCKESKLVPPHINTLRNRIDAMTGKEKTAGRRGRGKAEELYDPKVKKEVAENPLDVVHIDHTKLDVVIVDEVDREPLGRPWLTLLIDSCARFPMGFYLSLDAPGNFGTGYAISNAILQKDRWLALYGLTGEWPIWGFPKKLKCDNAGEFHSRMLENACLEYGIKLAFRPVKMPHYGGKIERLLGTFNKEIHDLPGTTLSNAQKRKFLDYDSAKRAAFTLSEMEEWLLTYITEVYILREHRGLGMSPLERLKIGIFGTSDKLGIGVPPAPEDALRLRLDLLPFEERTIQRYGVELGNIKYYHDVLRPWIKYTNPKQSRKDNSRMKFKFKIDPRDISRLYFLDPKLNQYFEIPYLDRSGPAMSKWEYKRVVRMLKERGEEISENEIFNGYRKLKKLSDAAEKKTKETRRANHRKRHMEKDKNLKLSKTNERIETSSASTFDDIEIVPFDGLEHESFT